MPTIKKIWENKTFRMFIDFCRIGLLIMMILIFIILIKEIEVVKILGSDVCKICMEKTGATCFFP